MSGPVPETEKLKSIDDCHRCGYKAEWRIVSEWLRRVRNGEETLELVCGSCRWGARSPDRT